MLFSGNSHLEPTPASFERGSWPVKQCASGWQWQERKLTALIDELRVRVLCPPSNCERFEVTFVGDSRRVLGRSGLGNGRLDALSVSLRELFREALRVDAKGILLAHNHPSGDSRPSSFDVAATQRISAVARSLEIALVDHLIFSHSSVYSMRKEAEL